MFISPFFAKLRYCYSKIVPANSVGKIFPMYMILRGPKSGGKSSIIATAQRLMFNRLLPMIPAKEIAGRKFECYKAEIKGCPILTDDVTNTNLRYMKEIVKDDHTLTDGKIADHGTFIFTTNDAEQIKQEISKRVVVFQIYNQLNEDISVRQDRPLYELQDKMSNAFYKHYLKKVFPKVLQMIDEIQDIKNMNSDWFPDIFKIASETLINIFEEYNIDKPAELKIFYWKDYLGEEIKSEKAMDTIEDYFRYYPHIFKVDKKNDNLMVDLSSLSPKDFVKMSAVLEAELPPSLEREHIGNIFAMKFSEVKKFSNIDFPHEKNLLERFFDTVSRKFVR